MESFKVLIFSDPHYSTKSEKGEEKWFPPLCDFLEERGYHAMLQKFLNFWDTVTQRAFRSMVKKAKDSEPYDLAIGLGDYTPGANEKGMLTEKTHLQYVDFESILKSIEVHSKLLVWGDHDVGYRFNVGSKTGVKIGTEKGGISIESVQAAIKLIGLPFGFFSMGAANFIFISTNLIRNVDENSDRALWVLKIEQESFLAKTMRDSAGNIFLLLHDPTVLTKETAVRKILDSYSNKITAIIHGHLHAEFSRLFAKTSPTYRGLCRKYKTILAPAPWGFMGIGGGFLVMNIYENGTYGIEKQKL